MFFIRWNINGLTGRYDEVRQLIAGYAPDFLCLQKVRSGCDPDRFNVDGYSRIFSPQDCGKWSGVCLYARIGTGITPRRIETPELSLDGHLQAFDCHSFALLNVYVPFGNPKLDGAVEYRRRWDSGFLDCVRELSRTRPVIICGDMNVVHTEYDSGERRLESTRANFTKWERDNFNRLLAECDLADPYRTLHPTEKKPTYYGAWRHLQMGNRIDYFLISQSLMPRVDQAEIMSDFGTGQSVPISLRLSV